MQQQALIIEDHPMVAYAMGLELRRSEISLEVHTCEEAAEALRLLADSKRWFRVFLDLEVPGAHGLSLARDIRDLGLHERCCVVTAINRVDLIQEVKRMGFLGYIVKACPYPELSASLAAVIAGNRSFPRHSKPPQAQSYVRLTRRQEQLLNYVRLGQSSKEIAEALNLSEGTVNNGITATVKALDAVNRTHAVSRAIELGMLPIASDSRSADRRTIYQAKDDNDS